MGTRSQKYFYIMLVKVVTGNMIKGKANLNAKTMREKGSHSTSNAPCRTDPDEIIVFHDAAAYPEYIVKFELSYGL